MKNLFCHTVFNSWLYFFNFFNYFSKNSGVSYITVRSGVSCFVPQMPCTVCEVFVLVIVIGRAVQIIVEFLL